MNPLKTVTGTIISGLVIALAIGLATDLTGPDSARFIIWLHVIVGVAWIGLLYYFNLVQVQALRPICSKRAICSAHSRWAWAAAAIPPTA